MPIEFDDQSIRVIGNNVRALQFYDNERNLQQEIFLQNDNTLNIGDTDTTPAAAAAVGVHALDGPTHTGALGNAQGPQFVLVDGSRDLTGNLDVDAGVTIDGVDISAHAADDDAHHDPVTLGAGGLSAHLGLSTQELTLTDIDHNELSSIAADDHHDPVALGAGGLSAHLNLSTQVLTLTDIDHNELSSIAADDHHDPVTIGAGGLSAKLSLSTQELTLAAINHSDISTVTADQHHVGFVGLSADSGSAAPAGGDLILIAGGTGLETSASGATLTVTHSTGDLGDLHTNYTEHDHTETISVLWTFGSGIDVSGTLEFQGAQSITTTSGNLTLTPAGDVILNPSGDDVLPGTAYQVNLGAITNKYLTLHAAELWVQTLVAADVMATLGGRIIIAPTTYLAADLGDGVGDTTLTVEHNNLANGDRVVLEAGGKLEWMAIASAAGGGGPYTYTVTRDLDGTGRNLWYAGDAVLNTGTTGDGFIDLYSESGITPGSTVGPTIVGNVRDSATYNDYTEAWAIGNLNGLYGYSADTYGVGLGKYGTSHVTIDPMNGIKFYAGSDVVGEWQPGGDFLLGKVAADNANLFWDQSEGTLSFRGGTGGTEVQAYVDTDGSIVAGGGDVILDDSGIQVPSGYLLGGANAYRITYSGVLYGLLYGTHTGSSHSTRLLCEDVPSHTAYLFLESESETGLIANVTITAREDVSGTPQESTLSITANGTTANAVYTGDYFQVLGDLYVSDDIISSSDTDTYIDLAGTADQLAIYAGGVKMIDVVEGGTDYVNFPAGLAFLNETSCADITIGICINQGANDDGALVFKSSDIAHLFYGTYESDTWGIVAKSQGSSGGLRLIGIKDADGIAGLALWEYGILSENADTTKTTAGYGVVTIDAYQASGGAVANMVANGNCVVFRARRGGATETIAIWDEDGDYYYDGSLNNYDTEDDNVAVWDLAHMLAGEYNQIMAYNAERFEAMGIVGPADKRGRRLVSHKRMTALQLGAIGQAYHDRLEMKEEIRQLRERCLLYERTLTNAGLLN